MKKLNVVVSGWYGQNNVGDELILRAMNELISHHYKDCELTFLSFDPLQTYSKHGVRAVRQIPRTWLGWIKAAINLEIFKLISVIYRCDIYIQGGGGFISDYQGPNLKFWLKQITLFKNFGAKTALLGVGIGPFSKQELITYTRKIINESVDVIVVRDYNSQSEMMDILRVSKEINVAVDPVAFSSFRKTKEKAKTKTIGLVIGDYFKQGYPNENQSDRLALKQLYKKIVNEIRKMGFDTRIMIFHPEHDLDFAIDLFGREQEVKITIVSDVTDAVNNYSELKGVVSFRLHGNILAYALNTPFLPIVYHKKTEGFLEQINYPLMDNIIRIPDQKCLDGVSDLRSSNVQKKMQLWLQSLKVEECIELSDKTVHKEVYYNALQLLDR